MPSRKPADLYNSNPDWAPTVLMTAEERYTKYFESSDNNIKP
jgi:hypothetical protein